ncbi:O-antigen ligase family protein [Desulfobacca acetoxidans]
MDSVLGQKLTGFRPFSGRWQFWLGMILGAVFLAISELEFAWFTVLFLGLLIGFISLAFHDKKQFSLIILVISLPIIIDINLYYQPSAVSHSTYGFQVILFTIPLCVLYLIWIMRAIEGRESPDIASPGLLVLAFLWCSCAVSVWFSSNRLYGVFDLWALFSSVLLYIYVANQVRKRQELVLVAVVTVINVAVQGILALMQYLTDSNLGLDFFGATKALRDYTSLAALSRAGGTLGHPNSLALFFDLTLPLTFSLLFHPMKFGRKFLLLLAFTAGLAGLTATLSRGGILAVGLASITLLLIHFFRRFGLAQAVVYVVLVLVVASGLILGTSNPIERRLFQHDYGTAYGRIPHLLVAINVIRANPLFGVGLNNYCEAAPEFDNTPQQIMAYWQAPAHNLYLFIASEIGLVGLIWVVVFTFAVVKALWPSLRSPDSFVRCLSLGVLLGLIAFFIHGQFDYANWTHFSTLWFMFGVAAALGRFGARDEVIESV